MTSAVERLLRQLAAIVEGMDALLDASTIDWESNRAARFARETRVLVPGMPDGVWGPLDDRQRQLQRRLLEQWRPWQEAVSLLFSEDTKARRREIAAASKLVEQWLERSGDAFSLPPTIAEAKGVFRRKAAPLSAALKSLQVDGAVVAIPDTNVIIRTPDIVQYGAVLGTERFLVLLVPGVLRELDAHKVNHRNPDVRAKAQKFSTRIKGWRSQGDLTSGVKVQGDIYVKVDGREPNFEKTLSWLQPDVDDDRILASILEVQRRAPSDRVVLLTGDNVMLAKADAARIATADTPDPDL